MSYQESLEPSSHHRSQWKIAANQVGELQKQYEIDSVKHLFDLSQKMEGSNQYQLIWEEFSADKRFILWF